MTHNHWAWANKLSEVAHRQIRTPIHHLDFAPLAAWPPRKWLVGCKAPYQLKVMGELHCVDHGTGATFVHALSFLHDDGARNGSIPYKASKMAPPNTIWTALMVIQ